MPAETLHTTHQGPKPGETMTESGIILPAGVDRQSNVRETIQFDNLEGRSTKYNSQGVDPDNPYNAFAPEAAPKAPGFADEQPRRSRTNPDTGAIEKLVKYDNGEFAWVSPDQAPSREKSGTERESTVEAGAKTELHEDILESVVPAIDELEESNEKQDEEISELRKQLAEQDEKIKKQSEQIDELIKQLAALNATLEGKQVAGADEHVPKYPGKELELYVPQDGEAVPGEELADEAVEGELEAAEGALEQLEEIEQQSGPELSPELEKVLVAARNKYAQLTAKHRASIRGHYLQNSTKLIAIPGVRALADRMGRKPDAEIESARVEYATALKALQADYVAKTKEEYEEGPELTSWLQEKVGMLAIDSEEQLEASILNNRLHNSGKISKLADWWVRQEGTAGKWKRAAIIAGAVVGGVGLGVAGGVTGIAALAAAGAVGGASIGFGMSRNINKKRGGVGDKGTATEIPRTPGTELATGREADFNDTPEPEYVTTPDTRVASTQREEDIAKKRAYAEQQIRDGKDVDVDELTRMTEIRTGDEKQGNRARTMAFTGSALAGAAAGIVGGNVIRDALDNAPAPEKPAEEVVEEEVPPVEAPVAPEIGENFEVEYANGITHEIRDLGAALGKDVPPQVTYDIYKELLAERGPNGIIETPTYTMADGDIGIANPGASSWQDGVRQSILDKLAARGL